MKTIGKRGVLGLSLSTLIMIILTVTVVLFLLVFGGKLYALTIESKDAIAESQFEGLVLNLRGLARDDRAFATRSLQFYLPEDYVIVAFDKERGSLIVDSMDVCGSVDVSVPKPEKGRGLVDWIKADPQCFKKSCLCLYKGSGDIFGSSMYPDSKEPERLRCLQTEGIDIYTTFHKDQWKARVGQYFENLTKDFSSKGVDTKLTNKIAQTLSYFSIEAYKELAKRVGPVAYSLPSATDADALILHMMILGKSIESQKDKLSKKGISADKINFDMGSLVNGYLNILGGEHKFVHYPPALKKQNDKYSQVFIYGECGESILSGEVGASNLYLEKLRYSDKASVEKTTMFVSMLSPLTKEREDRVKRILIEEKKKLGDDFFNDGKFFDAVKQYEDLLGLDLALKDLEPVVKYKLGYSYYQIFDEDRAISIFRSIADSTLPYFERSPYKMYSLVMLARIYELRGDYALRESEREENHQKALEVYDEAVERFTNWGVEGKKEESWLTANKMRKEFLIIGRNNLSQIDGAAIRIVEKWTSSTDGMITILGSFALMKAADLEVEKGEYTKGIERYERLRGFAPNLGSVINKTILEIRKKKGFSTLEEAKTYLESHQDADFEKQITKVEELIVLVEQDSSAEESGNGEGESGEPSGNGAGESGDGEGESGESAGEGSEEPIVDVNVLNLAQAYIEAGIYEGALSTLENFETEYPDSKWNLRLYYLRGQAYERLRMIVNEALDAYGRVEIYSNESEGIEFYLLALERKMELLNKEGRWGKEEGASSYAIKIQNYCDGKGEIISFCKEASRYLLALGKYKYLNSDYVGARTELNIFYDANETSARAFSRYLIGLSHREEQNFGESLKHFKLTILDAGLSGEVWQMLARKQVKEICAVNVQVCSGINTESYTRTKR